MPCSVALLSRALRERGDRKLLITSKWLQTVHFQRIYLYNDRALVYPPGESIARPYCHELRLLPLRVDTMASRGPALLSSLPNLQNLIKRDPASYTDEFLIQLSHYNALRTIIEQGITTSASGAGTSAASTSGGRAGADEERFRELVGFVAQVCNINI